MPCVWAESSRLDLSTDPADFELQFMLINVDAMELGKDKDNSAINIARIALSVQDCTAEVVRAN